MNKKDRYIYPAIFDYDSDGISVEFPDLPGCFTCGDTEEEAFQMAKEAMALHLYGLEQENEEIPQPSKVSEIQTEKHQVVVFVEVWMPPFRHEMENKAVKKTLTIPKWLDDLAKQYNVNYSQILQEALKKHLGATDR
ncbi:type II toxin-antitoxin system HicB family antitoxin [Anoxybacillus sp. LAT_35]|uniref:type II toxin-antitoxin system HicB family antitoxin n=1 Tax=unclassified Anoxybacillus TaxID=2639704 RepID=UPI001EDBF4ED|nr:MULTISPECIES: type II toxin-antitoxin system HicB family antitoxin [unclassified Anoxybacillus]MCG5025983.1 type II toxin-antitoxin system HicB family antitoxin [Anoxybacillus flavithermus]MCG3085591.1 type II toxin-antitoxin system HicB family antitoxin [Anoxybacillus sp. LAT27]MCG6170849.1 type II toxin-antitoxin system HicB family antitoxin [Anoxybacillus sp. LAT_11]MCG6175796.1 type II toxin-antitoxin system HicB family antitoxin [Anoxybacillus sp. LAT_31]MCG6177499.1 type II toxin-anti